MKKEVKSEKDMKRILLAVGYRPLEEFLQEQLKNEYEFVGVTVYREGIIKLIEQKKPDIVIIRETLEGKENLLNIVYQIKVQYPQVRIIFIAGKRAPGDSLLATLVSYSVYDILYGETINVYDLIELIRKPNQFKDVKHLQPVPLFDEKTNTVIFEAPEPIIKEKEVIKEIYVGSNNNVEVKNNSKKDSKNNDKSDNKNINKEDKIPFTPKYYNTNGLKQQIINFIGSKSGVGNTSVAINTAVMLAEQGFKVLFIELDDNFPTVSYWYDITKISEGIDTAISYIISQKFDKILNSVIKIEDIKRKDTPMKKVYEKFPDKLHFLFFSQNYTILNKKINMDYIEQTNNMKDLYFYFLTQGGYDFIIIDSKADIKRNDVINSIIYSNKLVFTVTQDVSSIGYMLFSINELEKKGINVKDKCIYVLNKYENALLTYEDIIEWIKIDELTTIPNDNKEFINANYMGLPTVINTKNKLIKDSFKKLVTKIIN